MDVGGTSFDSVDKDLINELDYRGIIGCICIDACRFPVVIGCSEVKIF